MNSLTNLLDRNKAWAANIKKTDPEFFNRLAEHQSPEFLWIGCSDSRVPPTQLVALAPGEMFVHRNIANVVGHTDFNCLSVIQYAVEELKVEQIIICGHYGCGGVKAAVARKELGLISNWLGHVQRVIQKHATLLDKIDQESERVRRVCELNVIEQVLHVCENEAVQKAWAKGQELAVDGLIYELDDGLLRELGISVGSNEELAATYRRAIDNLYGPNES
ncbi:MAG TPA: carbonate dehydratase [Blastocatellia bacterium]|nr:carbonate dehydratase [Blastocatellia bacterium]